MQGSDLTNTICYSQVAILRQQLKGCTSAVTRLLAQHSERAATVASLENCVAAGPAGALPVACAAAAAAGDATSCASGVVATVAESCCDMLRQVRRSIAHACPALCHRAASAARKASRCCLQLDRPERVVSLSLGQLLTSTQLNYVQSVLLLLWNGSSHFWHQAALQTKRCRWIMRADDGANPRRATSRSRRRGRRVTSRRVSRHLRARLNAVSRHAGPPWRAQDQSALGSTARLRPTCRGN